MGGGWMRRRSKRKRFRGELWGEGEELGNPAAEGMEIDAGGGAREVVAGMQFDVGLFEERYP